MKMKKGLLLLFFGLCTLVANAATPVIVVKTGGVPSEGDQPNPRSIECELTASIDDQVITVSFSDLTTSQIVVRDSANLTVFNQTFASAFSAQADLTSLTNGIYTLYIYAMGYWWYGQFEIE